MLLNSGADWLRVLCWLLETAIAMGSQLYYKSTLNMRPLRAYSTLSHLHLWKDTALHPCQYIQNALQESHMSLEITWNVRHKSQSRRHHAQPSRPDVVQSDIHCPSSSY
ncbi:hypothetical protein BDV95DRAFT_232710 [Massariosphaeria phaeospora]|uniref:Uncharacterized protein n=1 Tax=Massariosphaeria phaeospora TaxID=100035 RepID=A0A7C8ID66_9PLEO|nr:hypothetical protein BDV95DRAFT_232710 [Massariosphaeria phaeospora]